MPLKVGAITKETILINLIRIFIDGPDVSLNGSPTVSPVTDALCGSDFLYSILPLISTPFSNDFFALSQAPPALFWNIPINTPLTVAPAKKPPKTSGPNKKPITIGEMIAIAPGNIIFLIDALVEIATHLSY